MALAIEAARAISPTGHHAPTAGFGIPIASA
jgi:hypothetical protein